LEAHLLFLLLGLGGGAVYAILGLGLVVEYRASGVVNFAHAALAVFVAVAYVGLRQEGTLLLPVVGVPHELRIASDGLSTAPALAVSLAYAALLGLVIYLLVFRPLADSPPLAKLVASLGVMLTLQALLVLNFGSDTFGISGVTAGEILPNEPVHVLGTMVPRDRFYLAGITVLIGIVLWALFRFTTFGLATRGAAASERGISVVGYSRTQLGAVNWMLASVLAGLAGILIAPISGLEPTQFSLFVVPALAAALLGRLTSFSITLIAGLGLGMLQSEITKLTIDNPSLPQSGLQQGLPFLAIVIALVAFGTRIPSRDTLVHERQPKVSWPRRPVLMTASAVALGVIALLILPSSFRLGLILSLLTAVLAVSLVVLTGLGGQVSLAQMAFAGFGAFMTSIVADELGVGFPWSLLLGALASVALGLTIGLPALRVRGMHLAVLTLAAAVAMDALVFGNADFSGGTEGRSLAPPELLGLDLGVRTSIPTDFPRPAFGILVLVVLALVGLAVAYLRRSAAGRRMLAVRSNERAALAAGVSTSSTKLLAFGVSSFIAGLAGGMVGLFYGTVSNKQFGLITSLILVSVVYLGGVGRISGAVVAALLFAPAGLGTVTLQEALGIGKYMLLISSVGLVVVVVLAPDGLVQGAVDLMARLRRHGRRVPAIDGRATQPVSTSESKRAHASQPIASVSGRP
jgi:ABC-type branched-subunit amino acid transport system permease subunit